uniref:BPTI/Kunitz inhibitor domain-containing protein n=1 Tax=Sus scrofa TaxID=9823 RepID=A0A8W4FJW5_PIG
MRIPNDLFFVCVFFVFLPMKTNSLIPPNSMGISHADPCNMDVKYGSCFEIHFRFFFNKTSRTCEYFIYSGCDGNLNNYKLRIECQLACMKIPTQER